MISVKCSVNDCPHNGIQYDLLGEDEYVCCGGCGTHLQPYDVRPDPTINPGFPVTE